MSKYQAGMGKTVTISGSTHSDGKLWFSVLYGCEPVKAATTNEWDAREYARALYHAEKSREALLTWDGDSGTQCVIDIK